MSVEPARIALQLNHRKLSVILYCKDIREAVCMLECAGIVNLHEFTQTHMNQKQHDTQLYRELA